jgi:hypothetical protein
MDLKALIAKMDHIEGKQILNEGFPTVADAKARADKEKTTGKFDVKKTSTGTQYTRKSNTFTNDSGKNQKKVKKTDEGWEDMMAANKKAASEKGTGKFDVKKTSTGTQYTRKSNTFSDGGDKNQKKAKKTDEGIKDIAKKAMGAVKKAGSKALDTLGHGSDEDLIKGMQRKAGMPQTGKKPIAVKQVAKKSQNQSVSESEHFGGK